MTIPEAKIQITTTTTMITGMTTWDINTSIVEAEVDLDQEEEPMALVIKVDSNTDRMMIGRMMDTRTRTSMEDARTLGMRVNSHSATSTNI